MANISRRLFRPIKNCYSNIVTNNYTVKTNENITKFIKTSAGLIAIGGIVLYAGKKYYSVNVVHAAARPRKVTFLVSSLTGKHVTYFYFSLYLITVLIYYYLNLLT